MSKDLATCTPGHSEVWVFLNPHLSRMSYLSSQVLSQGREGATCSLLWEAFVAFLV